jgi:hypothetical protein
MADTKGAEMAWTETERRRVLQWDPEVTFVPREEFCRLLLSCRKLIRSDEPGVHIRGLKDVESGQRYLIEREELYRCV